MRDNFDACLAIVLKHEGGYVNDPRDPGGATMQGITQATYDAFRSARGLPKTPVKGITPAERNIIYRDRYWSTIRADDLARGVDLAFFDIAVNSGVGRARDWRPLIQGDPAQDIDRLCDRRLSFLHALKTWSVFGKGWGRRVADIRAQAHKMLSGPDSLPARADAAAKRVKQKAGTAAASGTATVGGPAVSPEFNWMLVALIGFGVALTAYMIWRAMQDQAQADAFTDAAKQN